MLGITAHPALRHAERTLLPTHLASERVVVNVFRQTAHDARAKGNLVHPR